MRDRYQTDLELRNISFTIYSLFTFNHVFESALEYSNLLRLMNYTSEHRNRETNYIHNKKYDFTNPNKKFIKTYHDTLKIPICNYRNEIIRRLPKKLRTKVKFHLYEDPTNLTGLGEVADDLESLARKADYYSYTDDNILDELSGIIAELQDFISRWKQKENELRNKYYDHFSNKNFNKERNESDSLRIEKEYEYNTSLYIRSYMLSKELQSRINMNLLDKRKFLEQFEYENGEDLHFTNRIINELKYLKSIFVERFGVTK